MYVYLSVNVYVISNISSGHIKVLDLVWLLNQKCLEAFFGTDESKVLSQKLFDSSFMCPSLVKVI